MISNRNQDPSPAVSPNSPKLEWIIVGSFLFSLGLVVAFGAAGAPTIVAMCLYGVFAVSACAGLVKYYIDPARFMRLYHKVRNPVEEEGAAEGTSGL